MLAPKENYIIRNVFNFHHMSYKWYPLQIIYLKIIHLLMKKSTHETAIDVNDILILIIESINKNVNRLDIIIYKDLKKRWSNHHALKK